MSNKPGLEKQLFHMDLSGGMDERSRPELMASNVAVTKIQNLVQNQTGAWVKSPGTRTTSILDDTGAPIVVPKTCFRSIDSGLCTVSADGTLYHYQENLDSWEKKNVATEFSVDSSFVSSSQSMLGQSIISYTSNDKYEVVVHKTDGFNTVIMVVYDRDSELEVKTYNLSDIISASIARVVFVSNRYLHIWLGTSLVTKLVVIDTLGLNWPSDLSAYTPITGGADAIRDVTANDTSSFAVIGGAGNHVLSATATGTVVSKVLTFDPTSLSLDGTGLLWVVGKTGTDLSVVAVDATNIATNVHGPWSDAGVSVAFPLVCAYASGKIGVVNNKTNTTFGGSTIGTMFYYETSGPSATSVTLKATLNGWVAVSMPFDFTIIADKIYVQAMKLEATNTTSPCCVLCLSDLTPTKWTTSLSIVSARLAATLNPVASKLSHPTLPPRPRVWNDNENKSHVTVYSSVPITARTDAFAAYYLTGPDAAQWVNARFGPANYIGCGVTSVYDGSRVVEAGFIDYPIMNVADSGNAGNPDGAYEYLAIFKYVNKFGDVTYSRTSGPYSCTVVTNKITMTVQGCHVTNKEPGLYSNHKVITEVYRTVSGGTQYYLCATSQDGGDQVLLLGASNGFFTFDDNLSDLDLQSKPLMYRQPGTPNSAVDRYAPHATRAVTQHKDRVFLIDPTGQNVIYSSFFVDGETAWFNPLFSFRVHGGTGKLIALASMDSRLFVFKRDGVWVIDGDGPPENGGTGAEFSTPQAIATSFGCIEPRSIVVTPTGIMYQSKRGIELLDHSLHVNWIGDKVQDTAKAFPVCTSAVLCHDNRRVRFSMLTEEPALITNVPGCVLTFDFTQGAWSKEVFLRLDGTPVSIQSACVSDILGTERTVFIDDSEVRYLDDDIGYEDFDDGFTAPSSFYVSSILETGWIRVSAPQARQRVYDALVLMKKAGGNHKITLELAFNYKDTYTQSLVFEPDTINQLDIEELLIQPNRQDVLAIRMRLTDTQPSDTVLYPIGTGMGFELLDITFNMAPKAGAPKLASIQKG